MKISTKAILLAGSLLSVVGSICSQTLNGTVVQPCNNNGQINVTVAGLTPPISYSYSNYGASQFAVHSAINSVNDNLTGIQAYWSPWSSTNIWYVTASDGINFASNTFTIN